MRYSFFLIKKYPRQFSLIHSQPKAIERTDKYYSFDQVISKGSALHDIGSSW